MNESILPTPTLVSQTPGSPVAASADEVTPVSGIMMTASEIAIAARRKADRGLAAT
jgi:hypothetical protein